MSFKHWFRDGKIARVTPRRAKLLLECLESRVVPVTYNWAIPANSGDWNTSTNWTPNGVPGAGDDAIITLTGAAFVTHSAATGTVRTLTMSGPLTVSSGSALTITNGLTIAAGKVLTDNGTVNLSNGATVTMNYSFNSTTGIVVASGGLLTAVNNVFFNSNPTNNTAQVLVNAGGQFTASNCTFDITRVYFDNGVVLNAGDITGCGFDSPVFVPAISAAQLANNRRFEDVSILAGSLTSGQSATLNPMGTDTTVNQKYVFPGVLTVQAGATLTVGSGTAMAAFEAFGVPCGITVNGTMNVTGATFSRTGSLGNTNSTILVSAGGHFTATNSTFAWSNLTLAIGSVLNSGDITGNGFDQTLTVPITAPTLLTNNRRFQDINILAGSLTSGQSASLNPIGTDTTVNQRYLFPGVFTVQAGATLSVGAGTAMVAVEAFGVPCGITVNGDMNVTGATFSRTGSLGNTNSTILVNAGGHLIATNSTFAWSSFNLAIGSILNSGDITGNGFDQTITVPISAPALLANNRRFRDVNILAGSLTSGQSASLNPIGADTTVNQRYVFPGVFTVQAGATLTVGAGTAMVALEAFGVPCGITVNGDMNVTGATFSRTGALGNTNSTIQVNAGGHLIASNSTFDWSSFNLAVGSILNAGDLTGNGFDQPITVPVIYPTLLANNRRFEDVFILAGNLTTGQSTTLNPIGTDTTANQKYVFTGVLTVQAGATLTVGAGTAMVAVEAFGVPCGITVNGNMNVTGAAFSRTGALSNTNSTMLVSAGGRLIASNSTFDWSSFNLAVGSILNAGDLTGNGFDQPVTIPVAYATLLASNRRFEDVNILAGTLTIGQTATLNPIGTDTTANQKYVFTGVLTVQAGATLTVGTGTAMVGVEAFSTPCGITVNGIMNVTGATFTRTGALSNTNTTLQVGTGGNIAFSGNSFAWSNMNLNSGSTDTVRFNYFASKINVHSAATVTIDHNDLINVGANGVVATGDPLASIDMRDNYWGTTDSVAIDAKILHKPDEATRPTVLYMPPLTTRSTQTAAVDVSTGYSSAAHNVTLTAMVTSPSGTVSEGNVTFTILDGSTPVGNPATYNVISGVASGAYLLPAGTPIDTYTIQAVFNGTSNYMISSDNTHMLTVGVASTTTAAANAWVTFSPGSQSASLSATVISTTGGVVNEGTLTFAILDGATLIGNEVTVNVVTGLASASYPLPPATSGGTYTLRAVYDATANFGGSSDATHTFSVFAASTATTTSNVTTDFSYAEQAVSLVATVTSAVGTVNEGTVTFTVRDGGTTIGSPIIVNVVGGTASGDYTLPAGTPGDIYTLSAVYSGTVNFAASSDNSHTLTVDSGATTTTAVNVATTYSVVSQILILSATVTSPFATVNEGTTTFTILSGSTPIGSSVTYNVVNGFVSGNYTLPAGTIPAVYTIQAVYNGTENFLPHMDSSHTLTVNPPPAATISLSLTAGSDSGAPDHSGYTNDTTPTFSVVVNQAGTIAIDFNGDSTDDQTFMAPAAGTYLFTSFTLANGAFTASASFDAGLAGSPEDSLPFVIDTVLPDVDQVTPDGTVHNSVAQILVSFDELVNLNTFTPAAITLTGPSGGIPVNQPQLLFGTTYRITFAMQTVQSLYSLSIAASVTDFAGNAMGQVVNESFNIALPDLAVTATSSPGTAVAGISIPVGFTVANVSPTNPTGGTWTDAVFISSNATFDGGDTLLISISGPAAPLAAGANYSRSPSVVIPGGFAGNYFLLFVANHNDGQYETDFPAQLNNVIANPITLLAPDLQASNVTGPDHGFTGQTVLLSWTVTNNGNAQATGPWMDYVYVASDAQGSNPTLIGRFSFNGSIPIGGSVQRTQEVILPQTGGTRWFMVVTNATQTVGEGPNFGNNVDVADESVDIVAVPLPDLVVTSITPPPNGVFSGNSVPVTFIVTNQGQAPTSVPVWHDWVILSQDPTLQDTYTGQLNSTGPGGDQILIQQPVLVGAENPSFLGVGDSYQQTVQVPLPLDAQGIWYIYVIPDGTGSRHPFAMPQLSRENKLTISDPFSITLSPTPDLEVSAVQAPEQNFSGQPMSINWNVTNTGVGPTVADAWVDAVYMSADATLDAADTLLGRFPRREPLGAGANYSLTKSVNLPVGVSGQFYFFVKTDLNGQVFENGATANNVAGTPERTVNLTPPPDLEVTSIALPPTAQAGHALSFSYTITNAGAGATPNLNWNDIIYLSPTPVFDTDTAIVLGAQNHQGSLAAGEPYTQAVSITLPRAIAGSFYVFVHTDFSDTVFELDNANNLGGSAGTVAITLAPADLVVASVTAPAVALPGTAIRVNWNVLNQGGHDTAVNTWLDQVFISANATFDGSAMLLGSFRHHGLVTGGGTYSQSELVVLPVDMLGDFHLFVKTDAADDVYESNNANNVSAPRSITLSLQIIGPDGDPIFAPVADLRVIFVGGTAQIGQLTVNWTVQNQGTGTTNATFWNDHVWVSTHATLGSGGTDVFLGSVQHTNPLAPGASYNASGSFDLPGGSFLSDDYYIFVITDGGAGSVYESNSSNNTGSSGGSTPLTPDPLADLSVSNVDAPVSAMSGGMLAVTWLVTNNAADTPNVPITDSVYLSFDQVYDPNFDRYLGSVDHAGGLNGGGSYAQAASLQIPAGVAGTFFVIVVTNANNRVGETDVFNNSGFDAQAVQVQLSPPADLVAGTITIPVNAVPGQNISISYEVTNNGTNPAIGSWYDSLYLSPTPEWNFTLPLLGRIYQTQSLSPGGSYIGNLTAPLPGVVPGNYFVILRSNILQNFPEPDYENNLSASLTDTDVDVPALTLGTATNGTLGQGQSAYYKVIVSAGETLRLSFTMPNPAAANELYMSFDAMPSRADYDYRYSRPFEPDQQITIPTTQAGVYYILAYGDDVPNSPEDYSILAEIIPFSIQAVSPGEAGDGPVTLQISGAHYDFDTTFELRLDGGAVIEASRILLQDSATAFATFDMTGQMLGAYDVWAIQDGGESTQLADGLNLVEALPNAVQIGLIVPSAVLVGQPGSITITYSNPGNTDLEAPLILVDGENARFQVPGDTEFTCSKLQLIGFNPAGPYGTLPPGFQGSINIPFLPITAGSGEISTFTVKTLADPNEPFDWAAVAAEPPVGTSPQQWAEMVNQASTIFGNVWNDLIAFVDNNTIQLVKNTAAAASPTMLQSLYNFTGVLRYAIGVYGSPPVELATPTLPELATLGEVTIYDASAGPLSSSNPTYVIVPGFGGYRDDHGDLAAALAADVECFPSGVNIFVVNWTGATAEPMLEDMLVPWIAGLHVEFAGTDLGNLLTSLQQLGDISFSSTTIIGDGLGVYVGNQAARIAGGLANAIALNPESAYGSYLPPDLTEFFNQSIAYETSSIFDTQYPFAEFNQTLPVGDLNDPVQQHQFGVPWLTAQVLLGEGGELGYGTSCDLLHGDYDAGPDVLPLGQDSCPSTHPEGVIVATGQVEQIISHDPNSIVGPKGTGVAAIVSNKQPMPYTILFANLAEARAPAQRVTVTETMDPDLDFRTFRLGEFGFGGRRYAAPSNSAYYQTRLDLREDIGFFVDFTATIDVRTGVATWIFSTIDPATGEPPLDPTVGFLPPDIDELIGQGFLTYAITPKRLTQTGDIVDALATIIFDIATPLDTAPIFNTLDAGTELNSAVDALPPFVNSNQFDVFWSGTDEENGAAIGGYTIYVSDNGGAYTAWLTHTALTSATFVGVDGHTYRFYSVAMDNAGNVEFADGTADATTTIDASGPITTADLVGPSPDDVWFRGDVTASLSASDNASGVAATYYTIDGGNPLTYTGSSFVITGAGEHQITYWSEDNAGNVEAIHSQTIHIDVTVPTLQLPGDQIFVATQLGGAMVNYTGATGDDDGSPPVITYSQNSGTFFPLGATIITVTITDAAGNQVQGTFTVTVTAAAPAQIVFLTGPQTLLAHQLSALVTVELRDQFGNLAQAAAGGVALTLSSSSTATLFLDDNGNTLPGASLTIAQSSSSGSFRFVNGLPGSPIITVQAPGFSATQTQTVFLVSAQNLGNLIIQNPGQPIMLDPATGSDVDAILIAVDGLPDQGTPIVITVNLPAGDYDGFTLSPPANVTLVLDGQGATISPLDTTQGAAVVVNGGIVRLENFIITTAFMTPTIRIDNGTLVLRSTTVQESTKFTMTAIVVAGTGRADLGTAGDLGNNTLIVSNKGSLIQVTNIHPVPALGNLYQAAKITKKGTTFTDRETFGVEDLVSHAMDGVGLGLVTWDEGEVYVTSRTLGMQQAVDLSGNGGSINVSTGKFQPFTVGDKTIGIHFANGTILERTADDRLVIHGSAGNDAITLRPTATADGVAVSIKKIPLATFNSINAIFAFGGAGNDKLTIQAAKINQQTILLDIPTVLNGGDGNDTITATGSSAANILIGGNGADRLTGGTLDDVLIGARTSFDTDTDALFTLLGQWGNGDPYNQRVTTLFNNGNASASPVLNGTTIFDDLEDDDLTGAAGDDWFITHGGDQVVDRVGAEVQTAL